MIGYLIVFFVLLVILSIPVGLVVMVLQYIYNKRDREIRNEAEAHRKILEQTYDHIWSQIKQYCDISEEYRRSFNNIYPNLIDTDMDDDRMLNWILDCNINFEPGNYAIVMENIDDDRARFVSHQRRMINLMREHRELHSSKFRHMLIRNPGSIFAPYTPIATNYDRWGNRL